MNVAAAKVEPRLLPFSITYHWTKDFGSETWRRFVVDDNPIIGFPPESEIFEYDGVVVELSRATASVGRHHYLEGDEEIGATDCQISFPDPSDSTQSISKSFPRCARLEICFPEDKPGYVLVFYKPWDRYHAGIDFGDWKVELLRYK